MIQRKRWWQNPLALAAICFSLFVVIAVYTLVISGERIDLAGIALASQLRSAVLTPIMIGASFIGEKVFMIPLSIVLLLLGWFFRYRAETIVYFIAMLGGQLFNEVIKYLVQRPRPVNQAIVELPSSFSFPSGHAMLCCIFLGIVCYFLWRFVPSRLVSGLLTAISIVLLLAISFSRIYLGVHYTTDVLAGIFLGFTWVCLLVFFYNRWDVQRRYQHLPYL